MIRKRLRKQSIFIQLFAMGLILMLVLLAAFIITSSQRKLSLRENTLNFNEQHIVQIENKMEEYYGRMTQIATVTAYSPTIYTYFFQDSVERVTFTEDVNTVFSNTILLENNISGIYVFDQDMELIASMGHGEQGAENMELIQVRKEQQEYSNIFILVIPICHITLFIFRYSI